MLKNRFGLAFLITACLGAWGYLICRYPHLRLFTIFVPLMIGVNCSRGPRVRNIFISVLVVFWLFVFHYESIRGFYLNPLLKQNLPKTKFLFPPAGWIMFFNVDETYGYVEVYGKKDGRVDPINPHDILRTRTIGFDNIQRNVLSAVGSAEMAEPFCRYLSGLLPGYDDFYITLIYYPAIVADPYQRQQEVLYQCSAIKGQRK